MTERIYTCRIDMTYKGREYRRGDTITSAAIGLERNAQFLLSRGQIALVEDKPHEESGEPESTRRKPGRPRKQ